MKYSDSKLTSFVYKNKTSEILSKMNFSIDKSNSILICINHFTTTLRKLCFLMTFKEIENTFFLINLNINLYSS